MPIRAIRSWRRMVPAAEERWHNLRAIWLASGIALTTLHTHAGAQSLPKFEIPIDCEIGRTCFIQNYVDVDPGPDAVDFRCGQLTYNGHKGTDFRLQDLAQMRRGVPVRAAASGVVVGVRDSMPDVSFRKLGFAAIDRRECGNGVRINHGNGWASQYCHLAKNSIRLTRGDRVDARDLLGRVGLSGRTEFPHLHFQIEFQGLPVDPFMGPNRTSGCASRPRALWRNADRIQYRSAGVINIGFSDRPPRMSEIEEGKHQSKTLPVKARALVFWIRIFGLRPKDNQEITISDPNGAILVRLVPNPVSTPKAQWMAYAGKRRPKVGNWSQGAYRGNYTLSRDGRVLISVDRTVHVR